MRMELHDQVRAGRRRARLTQAELAALAGVNRMDISRLEKGENLTLKKFVKIVNAVPNLTELHFGPAQPMVEGGEQAPGESRGEARSGALELLASLSGAPASRREQALIRLFAELLLEIAGGDR